MNWLCKLGFHKWGYGVHETERGCKRCPKTQSLMENIHSEKQYWIDTPRNG